MKKLIISAMAIMSFATFAHNETSSIDCTGELEVLMFKSEVIGIDSMMAIANGDDSPETKIELATKRDDVEDIKKEIIKRCF